MQPLNSSGSEWVKGCATKTNWKRRSLISGTHPLSCVILRKSGRTYFTENFGYIYIYIIDKNVNESTIVCSLCSLSIRLIA